MASTRRRVKLYTLNDDRQWDDRGTGHVSSSYVERLQGMSIMVRSEEDGSILLESKIQPHTAYQKQQETLIVWSEGDNYDLALSFQEKAGCDEIWEKICQIQGKDPSVTITQDIPEDDDSEERFEEVMDSTGPIELPACELSKLDEIAELFNSVLPSPIRREKLALAIEQDNYIRKMLDLFHICEDLENMEGLHHLYDIFKSLFFMNKPSLLEIMLADDLVFDVVGCLEYDPSKPAPQRHRLFLKESANFKEIIPITNSDIINKIHQTYRVQYIYDAILPPPSVFDDNTLSSVNSFILFNRIEIATHLQKESANFKEIIPITNSDIINKIHQTYRVQYIYDAILPPPSVFDDNTLSSVNSFILFNRIEIATHLQEDDKFLADMFLQLMDEDTLEERRNQLVTFLKEFVGFSLHLQLHQKDEFFKALTHHGLLAALEMLIVSDNEENRFAAVEMFSHVVDISPYLVRDFIMKEAQTQEEDMLINHMIDYMICDGDTGNAYQLSQLIRTLLDPENMALGANKMEKSEFLSFFYKHSMHVMTAPLFATTCDDRPSKDDYVNSVTLGHILELLTFCIEHHTYHIKNYVISKDLLRRVLVLMKSRHKFLVLNSLRFLRRIIGLKDEFYNRYIVKGQLFDPVISAFKENGQRYNLLNSAIVELFEFIRVEDIKSLCSHVCAKYMPFFKEVTYVSTFKGLLQREEQEKDRKQQNNRILERGGINHGIIHVNSRFRRDVRTMEEEEENWFDQEDENGEDTAMVEQNDLLNDDSVFKNRKSFVNEKSPPSIVNNKRPLIGLVDYPDDEEEDEDDDTANSPAKRARLNAS